MYPLKDDRKKTYGALAPRLVLVYVKFKKKNSSKIPLAPMGVLAPLSAHAGPSAQPPIGTSGNFPARVSAESISPNFPIFRSK